MPEAPKGGRLTIIPQWAVNVASGLLGPGAQPINTQGRKDPWFGPGQPMRPTAPPQDVAGRAFDYPNQYNIGTQVKQYEGLSFAHLRGMADSLDIVRLCIETRKDQMGKLTWAVLPMQDTGEDQRPKPDDRCRAVEAFLRRPDRKHTWDGWLRMIVEEQLVTDAVSIYVRRTVGGDPHSLEMIDGATIRPLIDVSGRMPEHPQPAYQQILKGMPAIDYTEEELLYAPRNPRVHAIYGCSVVQQLITTINIAVRREIVKLDYFTSGNIPDALISVPKDWSPDQISNFQTMWNALLANQSDRGGAKFVPGDMVFQSTRNDAMLMGPFDEWIARVVCYAFSLPPTAFVQQLNRSTAETANDTAIEEGLAPMMVWLKGLMDRIIQDVFKCYDLEFVFDEVKNVDIAAKEQRQLAEMESGLISMDEVRGARGLEPVGMGNAIWGGPNGVIFIDDLLAAKAAGLTAIQPPPQPQQYDEMGNPIPQMPQLPMGGPDATAPGVPAMLPVPPPVPSNAILAGPSKTPANLFDGIPSSLLAEVGLGPQGSAARGQDVTQADAIATDPLAAAAPHPQVRATLRDAEARNSKKG